MTEVSSVGEKIINQEFPKEQVSKDVIQAVKEAQLIVSYITHHNEIKVPSDLMETIVKSKYLLRSGKWTPKIEIEFWQAFNSISFSIQPVSTDSLKASLPSFDTRAESEVPAKTMADKAVFRYRVLAFLSLITLLSAQIYWIVGVDLHRNTQTLFEQRNELRAKKKELRSSNQKVIQAGNSISPQLTQKMKALVREEASTNQRFKVNLVSLLKWNRIWQRLLFRDQFQEDTTEYTKKIYKIDSNEIQRDWEILKKSLENKEGRGKDFQLESSDTDKGGSLAQLSSEKKILMLKDLTLKQEKLNDRLRLDMARNRVFKTILSADFALSALYSYLLPLLYGLLGACMFVLRRLSDEIRGLVYSFDSEVRFRLRLALGALTGMTIGWFMTPEQVSTVGSIGPMTIAFLAGYNVEILFSQMDSLIERITKTIEQKETITE
ncbi:MAG: hypothetical protein COB67_03965 [SAR324 cluster bacterium]|uniref:Uncharacterized protein n=1 Tax=SAR324 cluster bacterium TaxID=2024889 RepID=A0A2A4T859_9DELT|nr:MAG: hypothetical protein COB67_03965 [SAR324 cluster bacterium]